MVYVAIDPGPHTGITMWVDDKLVDAIVPVGQYGINGIHHILTDWLIGKKVHRVICESFVGQAYTKDEQTTIEIIGFIKGWCEYQGIPLQMQTPSVRKGYIQFATVNNYQKLSDISSDIRKHAKDSVAHALRYFHKEVKIWKPQL